MSDTEFLAKREAWLKLRKELEFAQDELDRLTAAYLRSEGAAPSRNELERIDDLLAQVHEARSEVDRLILENAT
jgi:hypothetical protein